MDICLRECMMDVCRYVCMHGVRVCVYICVWCLDKSCHWPMPMLLSQRINLFQNSFVLLRGINIIMGPLCSAEQSTVH